MKEQLVNESTVFEKRAEIRFCERFVSHRDYIKRNVEPSMVSNPKSASSPFTMNCVCLIAFVWICGIVQGQRDGDDFSEDSRVDHWRPSGGSGAWTAPSLSKPSICNRFIVGSTSLLPLQHVLKAAPKTAKIPLLVKSSLLAYPNCWASTTVPPLRRLRRLRCRQRLRLG